MEMDSSELRCPKCSFSLYLLTKKDLVLLLRKFVYCRSANRLFEVTKRVLNKHNNGFGKSYVQGLLTGLMLNHDDDCAKVQNVTNIMRVIIGGIECDFIGKGINWLEPQDYVSMELWGSRVYKRFDDSSEIDESYPSGWDD
jgi:hypothetical protein